jgi:hypothetical protein
MKNFLLLLAAVATPASAHHAPLHIELVCTSSDAVPGLVLLPFLLLAGIGIVRAVRRHHKDR